jgi:hypothetical protein
MGMLKAFIRRDVLVYWQTCEFVTRFGTERSECCRAVAVAKAGSILARPILQKSGKPAEFSLVVHSVLVRKSGREPSAQHFKRWSSEELFDIRW